MFGAFKDNAFSSQGYLFFFVLRSICTNLALAFLPERPLTQSIIMMLLTLAMVVYLGVKRPFKIIVNQVQQITFEMMILTVNIVLVILSIMDATASTASREGSSQVILTINLLFGFLPSGFLVAKVIFMGIEYYNQRKLGKLKAKPAVKIHLKNINNPVSSSKTENPNTKSFQISKNVRFYNSNPHNSLKNVRIKRLRVNKQTNNASDFDVETLNLPNSRIHLETSKNNLSTDNLLDSSIFNSSNQIHLNIQEIRNNLRMSQNQANVNKNIEINESRNSKIKGEFDNNPMIKKLKKRAALQRREGRYENNNLSFDI